MKILLTGGHLTPALAVIDYIQLHDPSIQMVFVGREFARSKQQVAHERHELERRAIPFVPLHSGKINFTNPIQFLVQSMRIVFATVHSLVILLQQRPDVCVTFGSYLAVPIALAAWMLRIPIITHEQTKTAGFANRVIGYLATRIAISYPESLPHFPRNKTTVTGNLVRQRVLQTSTSKPDWIPKAFTQPILYITGGSQGSEIINGTVAQILKPLLKDWCVIHQAGNPSGKRDYAAELKQTATLLSPRLQQRYVVREWISDHDLAWIYTNTTAAISRAGANTVEELAIRGIPTLFIPLPFSLNDEQQKNAEALANENRAIILSQKELNPETLLSNISALLQQAKRIRRSLADYQSRAMTALPAMHALIISAKS